MWNTKAKTFDELLFEGWSGRIKDCNLGDDIILKRPAQWTHKPQKNAIVDCLAGKPEAISRFKHIKQAIDNGLPYQFIFRGPPGNGKTSLAYAIGSYIQSKLLKNTFIKENATYEPIILNKDNNPYKQISEFERTNVKSLHDNLVEMQKNGIKNNIIDEIMQKFGVINYDTCTLFYYDTGKEEICIEQHGIKAPTDDVIDKRYYTCDGHDFYYHPRVLVLSHPDVKSLSKIIEMDDKKPEDTELYIKIKRALCLIIEDLQINYTDNSKSLLHMLIRERANKHNIITTNLSKTELKNNFPAIIDGFGCINFESKSVRKAKISP